MLETQACQRARLPGMGQESVVPGHSMTWIILI